MKSEPGVTTKDEHIAGIEAKGARRVATFEAADAKQEKGDTYSISGTASSARTPLAEPIFLVQSDHLSADSLELYRLSVKSGHREANVSGNRRGGGRALHLQVTKLGRNLYRLEASELLENGQYALSPAGSNKVFCFEVY